MGIGHHTWMWQNMGRLIYAEGKRPKHFVLVGVMDTEELAEEAVVAHNERKLQTDSQKRRERG